MPINPVPIKLDWPGILSYPDFYRNTSGRIQEQFVLETAKLLLPEHISEFYFRTYAKTKLGTNFYHYQLSNSTVHEIKYKKYVREACGITLFESSTSHQNNFWYLTDKKLYGSYGLSLEPAKLNIPKIIINGEVFTGLNLEEWPIKPEGEYEVLI